MSRLGSLSPAALQAMFGVETDADFAILLTLTDPTLVSPIRLADTYITRLSSASEDDVVYGIVSRGQEFVFMPLEIVLPTEQVGVAPRASLNLRDVTRIVLPHIRKFTAPPAVLLEIVLTSAPDVVEASFSGLKLSSISYNADNISGELSVADLSLEPFPQHAFSPAYFPGLF